MRLRRRGGEAPDVSLTPLIDVVFLLLIFFMLTATFDRQNRIDVDLPVAGAASATTDAERVVVTVGADGAYALAGRSLPSGALTTALRRALGEAADKGRLLIRADGRAPHQAVVTVMDAAARVGVGHIAIATAKEGIRP